MSIFLERSDSNRLRRLSLDSAGKISITNPNGEALLENSAARTDFHKRTRLRTFSDPINNVSFNLHNPPKKQNISRGPDSSAHIDSNVSEVTEILLGLSRGKSSGSVMSISSGVSNSSGGYDFSLSRNISHSKSFTMGSSANNQIPNRPPLNNSDLRQLETFHSARTIYSETSVSSAMGDHFFEYSADTADDHFPNASGAGNNTNNSNNNEENSNSLTPKLSFQNLKLAAAAQVANNANNITNYNAMHKQKVSFNRNTSKSTTTGSHLSREISGLTALSGFTGFSIRSDEFDFPLVDDPTETDDHTDHRNDHKIDHTNRPNFTRNNSSTSNFSGGFSNYKGSLGGSNRRFSGNGIAESIQNNHNTSGGSSGNNVKFSESSYNLKGDEQNRPEVAFTAPPLAGKMLRQVGSRYRMSVPDSDDDCGGVHSVNNSVNSGQNSSSSSSNHSNNSRDNTGNNSNNSNDNSRNETLNSKQNSTTSSVLNSSNSLLNSDMSISSDLWGDIPVVDVPLDTLATEEVAIPDVPIFVGKLNSDSKQFSNSSFLSLFSEISFESGPKQTSASGIAYDNRNSDTNASNLPTLAVQHSTGSNNSKFDLLLQTLHSSDLNISSRTIKSDFSELSEKNEQSSGWLEREESTAVPMMVTETDVPKRVQQQQLPIQSQQSLNYSNGDSAAAVPSTSHNPYSFPSTYPPQYNQNVCHNVTTSHTTHSAQHSSSHNTPHSLLQHTAFDGSSTLSTGSQNRGANTNYQYTGTTSNVSAGTGMSSPAYHSAAVSVSTKMKMEQDYNFNVHNSSNNSVLMSVDGSVDVNGIHAVKHEDGSLRYDISDDPEKQQRHLYRCRRCGQVKANHVCEVIVPPGINMSLQTAQPIMYDYRKSTPFRGDKMLTISKRVDIHTPFDYISHAEKYNGNSTFHDIMIKNKGDHKADMKAVENTKNDTASSTYNTSATAPVVAAAPVVVTIDTEMQRVIDNAIQHQIGTNTFLMLDITTLDHAQQTMLRDYYIHKYNIPLARIMIGNSPPENGNPGKSFMAVPLPS